MVHRELADVSHLVTVREQILGKEVDTGRLKAGRHHDDIRLEYLLVTFITRFCVPPARVVFLPNRYQAFSLLLLLLELLLRTIHLFHLDCGQILSQLFTSTLTSSNHLPSLKILAFESLCRRAGFVDLGTCELASYVDLEPTWSVFCRIASDIDDITVADVIQESVVDNL